jgi:hypothetical protein
LAASVFTVSDDVDIDDDASVGVDFGTLPFALSPLAFATPPHRVSKESLHGSLPSGVRSRDKGGGLCLTAAATDVVVVAVIAAVDVIVFVVVVDAGAGSLTPFDAVNDVVCGLNASAASAPASAFLRHSDTDRLIAFNDEKRTKKKKQGV